jgi:hypothetical protein
VFTLIDCASAWKAAQSRISTEIRKCFISLELIDLQIYHLPQYNNNNNVEKYLFIAIIPPYFRPSGENFAIFDHK